MTPRPPRGAPTAVFGAALFLSFLAAPAAAQVRTFASPEHDFRLRVPKLFQQVPAEPKDRQVLAKFAGPLKRGGEPTHQIWVVRIARQEGPVTGPETEEEKEDPKSFGEQKEEYLNGGQTPEELLKRRGIKHDLRPVPDSEKQLETKDGHAVVGLELVENRRTLIRTYLVETPGEYFGIVALGHWTRPFDVWVQYAVKTLERVPIDDDSDGEVSAADLPGADYRAKIRASLSEGWEAYDTENFILVTNVRRKRTINKMLEDLEIMRTAYEERFPPLEPIEAVSTVRVFASYDEYMAYGAPRGSLGYWSFVDEELVLFDPGLRIKERQEWLKEIDSIAIMYHEAMHQYLHYANGTLAPASWFNEGYGEVFGGADLDRRKGDVKRFDLNKGRMIHIKQAQRLRAWPDLRVFVKMIQPEFYDWRTVYQNYAFAWAFCYFLEQQREDEDGNPKWAEIPDRYLQNLREITAEYRERVPENAPKDWINAFKFEIQRKAFDKTFHDIDFVELEEAWIEAMRKWR